MVQGVAKSQTWLKRLSTRTCMHSAVQAAGEVTSVDELLRQSEDKGPRGPTGKGQAERCPHR